MIAENNNHNKNNNPYPLNPFSPFHPSPPEHFADRRRIIVDVSNAIINTIELRPPKPPNFALLGDWGIGKTSLAYKLSQVALEELPEGLSLTTCVVPLRPQICENFATFYSSFLAALKDTSRVKGDLRERIRKDLRNWEISINLPLLLSATRKGTEASRIVSDQFEDLWKKHLEPYGVKAAILFLDDADHFLHQLPEAYFDLRNLFQGLAQEGCNYSLAITGPSYLFTEAEVAEPFARFFRPYYLEPFDLEGTAEAIQKPLGDRTIVSESCIKMIHDKSQGHPYFVSYIMYELINQLLPKAKIVEADFEKAWPSVIKSIEISKFQADLGRASPAEKEVLLQVAKIDGEVAPSSIKGVKGVTTVFSRLERKGHLIKQSRGRYTLYHPLFRDYLLHL